MAVDTATLIDRLRGNYTVPLTDCDEPLLGSNHFTRQFVTSPICHEAADEIERLRADAARWRKVMDLAAYGGTYKGEHVWRFRPIMGPHKNLLDAIDHLGEQ